MKSLLSCLLVAICVTSCNYEKHDAPEKEKPDTSTIYSWEDESGGRPKPYSFAENSYGYITDFCDTDKMNIGSKSEFVNNLRNEKYANVIFDSLSKIKDLIAHRLDSRERFLTASKKMDVYFNRSNLIHAGENLPKDTVLILKNKGNENIKVTAHNYIKFDKPIQVK